jgi:hypothetical protein
VSTHCEACRRTEPEHTDRAGSPIVAEASLDPSPALDRALAGRQEPWTLRYEGDGVVDSVLRDIRGAKNRQAEIIEAEQRRLRQAAHAAYDARTGTIEVTTGVEAGDDDDRVLAALWQRTRESSERLRAHFDTPVYGEGWEG